MDLPTAPSGPPGAFSNGGGGPGVGPDPASARGDPSRPRREDLKKHERPPIDLSNLCPIAKYYAAADKVYDQFKAHLAEGELDDAYVIGRRFALFSTVSLPKHDYYASPREDLVRLRLKNQKDAQWVTRGLERIVEVMDKQEIDKRKAEAERLRKQKEEEEEKRLEWEISMRQRLGTVGSTGSGKPDSTDSGLDMASKLERLSALFLVGGKHDEVAAPSAPPSAPTEPAHGSDQTTPLPPPMAPPLLGKDDTALFISTSATQQLKSNGATPFYSEETEPPNYSDLFLDTLRTSTPTVSPEELSELEHMPAPTAPITKLKPVPRTPIRIIQRNFLSQMQSLKASKHIEIIKLGTYQGRLSAANPRFDSTNGCTVISPLVVATHIYPQHTMKKQGSGRKLSIAKPTYGISNQSINEIIDRRAPPILQTVRSKLGLNKHALIIPSDVHDYLVDEHILPQEKFVGVCGGDIMDENHTNELVSMLVHGRESSDKSKNARRRKVGAALFFREHVVSIVKIPLGNGACYFDLVDSLPSHVAGGMASRTRCKDLASFEALLRWYATSKFSESHIFAPHVFTSDFDPRVFQGFVWAE